MSEFAHKRQFGPTPSYDFVKAYRRPDRDFKIISGSCSIESEFQVFELASIIAPMGVTHMRGGVYRAGTYPNRIVRYGYVDEYLIKSFHDAAHANDMKNVIEVIEYDEARIEMLAKYCDVFQIGARAMQHYPLLRSIGSRGKPVFLKRHPGSTVDETLGAVEHLLTAGAKDVSIIERGSSTFHNDVRWCPSVHVIPSIHSICDVPVIWDASHSTGRMDIVKDVCLAGVAAGADGILVECHKTPEKSLSDAEQAITPNTLLSIIEKSKKIRDILG
jgi:3-deoxy-7-phosphoheptulonate synthase